MGIDGTAGIDTAAWREFTARQAPSFDGLGFLPKLLDAPARLADLVVRAISTAAREPAGDLRIRAFRPGILDYRLTQALSASAPRPGEGAPQWLSRVAGDRAACVAVNSVSEWSLELAGCIALITGLMCDSAGCEFPSGIDPYVFVADAGWTPFGVHSDPEPSMIFHLGPAEKEVWVWPPGSYDDTRLRHIPSIGRITFDIESQLPCARHFRLAPGDFLCIPTGAYHVFRNLGPSVFLGMSPYPPRYRQLITDAFWRAASGARPAGGPSGGMTGQLLARADAMLTDAGHPGGLGGRMADEIRVAQTGLRTSGRLVRPHRAALPTAGVRPGAAVRWAYPGVVEAVATSGGTVLCARGREIRFNAAVDFTALADATRSGARFRMAEAEGLLPREIDGAGRRELTRHLYRTGALVAA